MNKRKIILAAAILMIIGVAMPNKAAAQKYQGQSVITGGVGFSLTGLLFSVIERSLDATTDISSTRTPVLIGAYDYGLSDRFSIGVGYTYQSLTLKYDSYYFNGMTDSLVTGNFTDRVVRQNFGIRPLFHFGDNDDLDIYAGVRLSAVRWSYTTDRTDIGTDRWVSDVLGGFSPVKVQGLFGMRYFFTENIGFNTELAIGPSYFAMVGINARFGGN
ncbi:MAG: outer membrane beta-barrel protein [Bacteroidetes bacterium]|nr:outer membrane beta-barrel protein [Bacteroidota bacterium]